MKTIIALSALATIAIAVPTNWGQNGVEHDSRLNGLLKTVKRERKSAVPESPAELSLNHDAPLSGAEKDIEKTHQGFKKPIIVKKKFGYHIYRDSDEELAQAEPRTNCRRQFRFKLCDESDETAPSNMRTFNTEDIEESDVHHSLKMAKEAVEILQRDLQKIEESTKTIHKSRKEDLDVQLHKNLEQARQTSEQLNQNIDNLESLAMKAAAASKESAADVTNAKLEEDKMAQWKEAMENIQKNVEIVKNIEDAFSSEHTHALTDEEWNAKSKTVESSLSNDESSRKLKDTITSQDKEVEILSDDNKGKHSVSDMETFATENKQVKVGLQSDSLKLENAENWDITENVRHAENDIKILNKDDKLQDVHVDFVRPQEKNVEIHESKILDPSNLKGDEVHLKEEKSVQQLGTDDLSKKTEVLAEKSDTIQQHKSVVAENDGEKLFVKSNEIEKIDDTEKHMHQGEILMRHGELHTGSLVNKPEEKKAETENTEDIAKEAIVNNENSSVVDASSHLLDASPMLKSVDSAETIESLENSRRNTDSIHVNDLKMREALEEDSNDKLTLGKSTIEEKIEDLNNMRAAEEINEVTHVNNHKELTDDKTTMNMFKSSDSSETHTKIHEHIDAKKEAAKKSSHESTVIQKSVDVKNMDQDSSHHLSNKKSEDRKMIAEASNMRFVGESGDQRGNMLAHKSDTDRDIQQRMSEMDFFNNLDSQHTAQLVQDKNLDFHTSSHVNEGISDWERQQQQMHSMHMMRPPFMPWMNGRMRNNIDSQIGNLHDHHLGNIHVDDHHLGDLHQHDHRFNNLHLDHHHHAIPMGRFVNDIQTINPDLLNSPMMRENILEGGSMDLDTSMQPSMKMNMRDALDQNGMPWNYHQTSGKSGFAGSLVGSGLTGSGAVGVFPTGNSGCGIPLLLSCSPSVVSGSLAKQALGFPGHGLRSGDDQRFYMKRDALGSIESTKLKPSSG
ncbi:unnamed protein product [Leptosia nina]|uniref:Uncharacterized protein n=1 Tax=Leptosia nina TaxID=320188 RepID=A0AAV1J9H4_9NEOP